MDLLLTMNPRQVPSSQVDRADLEKHERTRALTSPRQALASTVLPLNLALTLILLLRADDHRDHPSKMRAVEGDAQHFQRDRLKLGMLLQIVYAVGWRRSRADGRSGPAGTELHRRARKRLNPPDNAGGAASKASDLAF